MSRPVLWLLESFAMALGTTLGLTLSVGVLYLLSRAFGPLV